MLLCCTGVFVILVVFFYLFIGFFLSQGVLKEFLTTNGEQLSVNAKINICSEIAKAMDYLSINGIIHHDLACRNCLVVSKDCGIKVAFFSLSEDTYEDDYCIYNSAHVPLRWLSPEALIQTAYSEKSGVWAFGVVIWEVFSNGKQPYPGKTNEEVIKSIKKKNQLAAPEQLPDQLNKLMKNCFRLNPEERPKFSDIVTTLEDMQTDSKV